MTTVDERTDAYFDSLSAALSSRLKDAKGEKTYADLEEVVGKRPSTMSGHLRVGANLTLRTIAQYEVALGENVYSVRLDAPKSSGRRRRRSRPEGGWTAENESREADPVETRLFRVLTRLSRRIIQLIQSRDDLNQQALAEEAGIQSSHLSRLISGSVNPTLRTIARLEAALNTHLLQVDGRDQHTSPTSYHASFFAHVKHSNDGGYCSDPAGVVTNAMDDYAQKQNQPGPVEESPVAA